MGFGSAAAASPVLVFVSNEKSGTVTVIDSDTDRIVDSITLGSRPRGIQASPDGSRIYVAVSDSKNRDNEKIVAIDSVTHKIVGRYPSGTDPEQFAVSPDGKTVVIANEDASAASILDLPSARLTATLPVGTEPEGVGFSPDGRFAWVTGETSNNVSIIDIAGRRVAEAVPVDQRPRVAAFTRDGRKAYVSCEISATIVVLDPGIAQTPGAHRAGATGEAGRNRVFVRRKYSLRRDEPREHRRRDRCPDRYDRGPHSRRSSALGHRDHARREALHGQRSVQRRDRDRCRYAPRARDDPRGSRAVGSRRRLCPTLTSRRTLVLAAAADYGLT